MTKIQSTIDYNLFKRITGNRKLNKSHVRALTETLADKPHLTQLNPIIVDKDYTIIDGQHRAEASKQLGLPIYYVKGDNLTLEDVQALNASSKNWTPVDFAKSFADNGNDNYAKYLDYKSRFKLNHDVLMVFLCQHKPMTSTAFKKGLFEVTIDPFNNVENLCKEHADLKPFYKGYNRRAFCLAFKELWDNKRYNHKRMLQKLEHYSNEIQDYSQVNDYIRMLERIYNKRSANKVRFF